MLLHYWEVLLFELNPNPLRELYLFSSSLTLGRLSFSHGIKLILTGLLRYSERSLVSHHVSLQ